MAQETEDLDIETVEISVALFMLVNAWHAEHEGEPLTLTAEQVCDLAGCALGHEYAGQGTGT